MLDPHAANDRSLPTIGILLVPLSACIILSAGCNTQLPGKPDRKDRPVPAEKVLAFDVLYNQNCAGCHGPDGKQGAAPPLNDPLFRAIVPQSELEAVLEMGRPWTSIWRQRPLVADKAMTTSDDKRSGTSMAPFAHGSGGPLSTTQIQVLVHEIKGVPYRIVESRNQGRAKIDVVADARGTVPRWGAVSSAPGTVAPYLLPEKNGNVERGKTLFAAACASCHGENGEGVTSDGQRRQKINDVTFLSLISDQALRRIIITGRPDLHMPDYLQKDRWPNDSRPLSSSEIADLGALLSSWRAAESIPAQ